MTAPTPTDGFFPPVQSLGQCADPLAWVALYSALVKVPQVSGLRPDGDVGEVAGRRANVSLHELVLYGGLATKHTDKHMTWGVDRWVDNLRRLAVGVVGHGDG